MPVIPEVVVGDPVVDVMLTDDYLEQRNDGFPTTTSGMTTVKQPYLFCATIIRVSALNKAVGGGLENG
jgi:hypothetical protein